MAYSPTLKRSENAQGQGERAIYYFTVHHLLFFLLKSDAIHDDIIVTPRNIKNKSNLTLERDNDIRVFVNQFSASTGPAKALEHAYLTFYFLAAPSTTCCATMYKGFTLRSGSTAGADLKGHRLKCHFSW